MNGPDRTHDVVVGYDGSPGSQLALDWAVDHARRHRLRLTLVHGVDVAAVPAVPGLDLAHLQPSLEEAAKRLVDEGAVRAGETLDTTLVTTQYWLGNPAAQIVEISKDADLVVVGSRARGRVLAGLLGSTSYAVAAHAHCPVVIVRGSTGEDGTVTVPRPDARHPVVVGIDGSPISDILVDAAAEVAQEAGAALHVVQVAPEAAKELWTGAELARGGTEYTHALGDAAELSATRAANRVRAQHPRLVVVAEAPSGDPGRVLAAVGADAGLLVVGSRGRGGFAGMLLGSVSHRVVHDAVCPVMVVH